jgi:pimeloyl-ACP methyl ester carboxylesterase
MPQTIRAKRSRVALGPIPPRIPTILSFQNADPIQGIPVLLLAPGKSAPLSEQHLRRIGKNVLQIIAPASAHWIHLDEPDLVIDSIRKMVAQLQSPEPSQPQSDFDAAGTPRSDVR